MSTTAPQVMQAATHTNTHTCHYLYHSPCNANERLKCPSLYSTCCFAIPSKQHNTHTHNNTSTTHHATLFSLHAPVDTEPWAPWHDPQGIAAAHTNTPHTTQRKRATHMTQSIQCLGHHGMTLRALLQHTLRVCHGHAALAQTQCGCGAIQPDAALQILRGGQFVEERG